MFRGMRLTERVQLFRELATLVDSGLSLGMALGTLEGRNCSLEQRIAVHDAAQKVSRGKRFSEVMKEHPRVFSELQVSLVAAGEKGGHLDTMLNTCADYLEKELEFQQTLARETLYPKLMLAAVICIPLATRIIIAGLTESGSAAARIVFCALTEFAFFVLLPLYLLYFAFQKYQSSKSGRLKIDQLKLHLPLVGPIVLKLAWARFSRAFAALYGAGVNIRIAVPTAARTTNNGIIYQKLVATVPAIERGEKLSDALAKTGQVPALAMSMLRTGEQTGGVDSTMNKVADYFEAEAFTSVRKATIAIVPVATIIFGIVVAVMLVKFYGGYFSALLNQ